MRTLGLRTLSLLAALLAALPVACGGSEPPPPASPAPPVEPTVATVPAEPERAAPAFTLESYELLWEAETPGWNRAIAFMPDGDVVAVTGGTLTAHARHDGTELRRGTLCESQLLARGVLWTDARGFVMGLCNDGLHEVRLQDLARRRVHALPEPEDFEDRPTMAVVRDDRIALASRSGKLIIRERNSFAVVAEHQLDGAGDLRSMCFATDGTLAISRRQHPTVILRDGRVTTYDMAPIEHGFFAFSPDGSRAFVVPRYFIAGELILAEGLIRGESRISSWLTHAQYLTDTLVVATGANGLALYDVQMSAQRVLDGDTGEGLAVRADGSVICAAGRRGRLVCFGAVRPQPSQLRPLGESG